MIVAERKPVQEIIKMCNKHKKILIAGCKSCVTVCMAGGEKEVKILSTLLKIARKKESREIEIIEVSLERQCEKEFVKELKDNIEKVDAVISLACGAGVQFIAKYFPEMPVYPGVNTKFLGGTDEPGLWTENCQSCGDCILDKTGGICPVARCSKSLLNGPCGGSQDGKCEVNEELDCAWHLICEQMERLGRIKELEEIQPPKDWSRSRDGGPRKVVREDLKL